MTDQPAGTEQGNTGQQWPVTKPEQGYLQPQQPQQGYLQPQQPQQGYLQPQQPQQGYLQPQQTQGGYVPAQPWNAQPQQYAQPQPQFVQPQIVINNTSASSAAAAARVGYGFRKRQSVWVHVLLFLTTAGIGNIIYAVYVSNWNRNHGF